MAHTITVKLSERYSILLSPCVGYIDVALDDNKEGRSNWSAVTPPNMLEKLIGITWEDKVAKLVRKLQKSRAAKEEATRIAEKFATDVSRDF